MTPATISVQAEVNWAFLEAELNNGDNLSSEIVRPLHVADRLKFHFVPVHLHEPAANSDTEVDPNSTVYEHNFLQGPKDLPIAFAALRHLPASQDNAGFILSWQGIPVTPLQHNNGVEWNLKRSADRTGVNERLKAIKLMSDDPDRIFYGMVHVDAATGGYGGWANNGVAWGVMSPNVSASSPWRISGGMILAHESGHRKGLAHMLCSGNEASGGGLDPNYPWQVSDLNPCRLADLSIEGYYGLDVYHTLMGLDDPIVISNDPSVAQPNRGFPLMGYKSPQWVSPYEFCKMMPNFGVPCDLQWSSQTEGYKLDVGQVGSKEPTGDDDLLHNADEYLVLSGVLDARLQKVHFGPFYRREKVRDWKIEESLAQRVEAERSRSDWSITLENKSGVALYRHALLVKNPDFNADSSTEDRMDNGHPSGHGPSTIAINSILPFPKGTQWIRVWNQDKLITSRAVSHSKPQVSLLSPNGGETLSAGDAIKWKADDSDHETLFSSVRFSSDAGRSWQVIALDLKEQSLVLTEQVLSSLGATSQGLFEIIVTDGVNSGSDRSDTVFKVPNAKPFVSILPMKNKLIEGLTVTLRAQSLDPEDGLLVNHSISWFSDRDGELGSGESLKTRLSLGSHLLTVTAVDGKGAKGSAEIRIEVKTKPVSK